MKVLERPTHPHPQTWPAVVTSRHHEANSGRRALSAARLFFAAVAIIAFHVVDAVVRQGPEGAIARVGLSAFGIALAVLTCIAFGRSPRWLRGVLAAGIGFVAGIEGAGVAVAHAIKGTAAGPDATGLVSTLASVTLIALGTTLIVRSMRGWQRWLSLPAAALLLVYVAAPLAMAVNMTHSNPGRLSGRTPADAGLAYHDVAVQTQDGVLLSGWYIPSRNGGAVMTIPGAGGTRDGVLDHAIVLAQRGYGVLDLDPRGHGISHGAPMDLGWYGELDVDAGVSFLSRQPEVDPRRIAVLGTSMGGEEALTTAALDKRISAVVNEGGCCRVFGDLQPLFERDPMQAALIPYYWTFLTSARFMTSAKPPIPLARTMPLVSPRPVLLIAASEQPEMLLMTHLQDQARTSSDLWMAPETPHTQALYVHPEEWTARVLNFLDKALLESPA